MHTGSSSFSLVKKKKKNRRLVIRLHVECHADRKIGLVFKCPCDSQCLLFPLGLATFSLGRGSTSVGHRPHFSEFLLLHENNTRSKTESYNARTCSDAMSAFRRWKASCWAGSHTQAFSFLSKSRALSSLPNLGKVH